MSAISAYPPPIPAPTASPQFSLSRAVHSLANELQAWQEESRDDVISSLPFPSLADAGQPE